MKLISNDLKSVLNTNGNNISTKSLMTAYMKKRMVSIVVMVIVLMLLVTTSLFTDLGLNIGQAILNFLGF